MKFFGFIFACIFCFEFALAQDVNNKVSKKPANKKPVIVASISPIYQIILAITQDQKNAFVVINNNVSEHDYQLKKKDLLAINTADLIFYIDAGLEHSFSKAVKGNNSYALSKVKGMKILMQKQNQEQQDFHLWLNPQNGVKIAEFITAKLCEINQSECEFYRKNFTTFKSEVQKVGELAQKKLAQIKTQNYSFYHDSFWYFEEYFSLKPVDIVAKHHDSELTVNEARKFFEVSKKMTITCLFGDVSDSSNSPKKLAQNYKMAFVGLDFMGVDKTYPQMISEMANQISSCVVK